MSVELLKTLANIPEEYHQYLEGMDEPSIDMVCSNPKLFTKLIENCKDYYPQFCEDEAALTAMIKERVLQEYSDASKEQSL